MRRNKSKKGSDDEASGEEEEKDGSDSEGEEDDEDEEEEGDDFIPGAEENAGEEAEMAAMNRAIDGEESDAEIDADSDIEPEQNESDVEEAPKAAGKKRKNDKPSDVTSLPKYNKRATEDGAEVPAAESLPDAAAVGTGGAHWVMQRMRGIGADFRGNRRTHVIKVIFF